MPTASSNFDNSENPLSEGSTWTSGPGAAADVQKVSGFIRVVTADADSVARYEGVSFASNHESEVTIQTPGNNVNMGPTVRVQSSSDPSCYVAFCIGTTSVQVSRIDSSMNFTNVGAAFTGLGLTAGSRIKLAIVGSTLTVSIDGTSQGTRTDATLTGGQPGIHAFAETGHTADDLITSWTATDGIATASFYPRSQMRLPLALLSI